MDKWIGIDGHSIKALKETKIMNISQNWTRGREENELESYTFRTLSKGMVIF